MKSKLTKWLLRVTTIIVLLLMTVVASIFIILPGHVENKLIPRLSKQFGLTPQQIRVRRIGLFGADLGPIIFKEGDAPAITFTTIQIDYSPVSLLRGEISGIALGGVELKLSLTPDGVSIAGLTPPPKPETTQPAKTPPDLKTLLPIKLSSFSIVQSRLILNWNGRRHDIPFDIKLNTGQLPEGIFKGRADLSLFGNPLMLSILIDQPANNVKVSFDTTDFVLDSLSQLEQMPSGLETKGTANLKGWGTFNLETLNLTGISISGVFRNTHIATPQGALHNLKTGSGDAQDILFTVKGERLSKLHWSCAPFSIRSPIIIGVKKCQGELGFDQGKGSIHSVITTTIPAQVLSGNSQLLQDMAIRWQMDARQGSSNEGMVFQIKGIGKDQLRTVTAQQEFTSNRHELEFKGRLHQSNLYGDGQFIAKEIQVRLPEGNIQIPGLNLDATVAIHPQNAGLPSSLSARLRVPKIRSHINENSIYIPQVSVEAQGYQKPGMPWHFNAGLKISKGRIGNKSKALKASGFSMNLPLQWPPPQKGKTGKIRVNAIEWKKRQLGGIKGTLKQQSSGLALNLRHASKLFPGLLVLIKGRINTAGAQLDVEIPAYEPKEAIDLGRFSSSMAYIEVNGQIEAKSSIKIDSFGPTGSARVKLRNGRLHQEWRELLLDGIDMDFHIEDIAKLQSAPKQKLSMRTLTFGNLAVQNLDVDFQLEDGKTLFFEKVGLEWCKGKINTSAIRIIPGKDEYHVTLFCDRLNLAMVLEQLGAAKADGDGTVNGRIPIHWAGGRLTFDNGFLFSTPGQSGVIQITGTEALMAGLPPGTPQHTQLDIAREALKNYTYKWAKVNVLSQDDKLLLKLQLDGKPNRLLPFAYNRANGQLKRDKKGQADFKGLGINLNFKSPLDDILYYKDLLKP